MKVILKIFTQLIKGIILLLILIILVGLTFKTFNSSISKPIGKIVKIGSTDLHVVASGEKNLRPTVVIEAGAGLPTGYYHWLDEGLKDSLRVIRYDRSGVGHSDEVTTSRDAETVAKELHVLLEESGESPPYILVGHSIGGPLICVFNQLYPEEVVGMVFLDATNKSVTTPEKSSFKFKLFIGITEIQALAAELGIFILYEKVFGNPYKGAGLPDEINEQVKEYLSNGKTFRAYREEMKNYHSIIMHSRKVSNYGNMPIRSFVAVKKKSLDNQEETTKIKKQYWDYEDLSENSKRIDITGTHTSIFTKKENAKIICDEILNISNNL